MWPATYEYKSAEDDDGKWVCAAFVATYHKQIEYLTAQRVTPEKSVSKLWNEKARLPPRNEGLL